MFSFQVTKQIAVCEAGIQLIDRRTGDWFQHEPILFYFKVELIAWLQAKFLPQRLGND
jgi:hypothetical protein